MKNPRRSKCVIGFVVLGGVAVASSLAVPVTLTAWELANIAPASRDWLTRKLKLDATEGGLPFIHPVRRAGRGLRAMGIGIHDFFVLGPLGRKAGGEGISRSQLGKFETSGDTGKKLHKLSMDGCDSEIGDVNEGGWFGLLVKTGVKGAQHTIISEDEHGFFYYEAFKSEKLARAAWKVLDDGVSGKRISQKAIRIMGKYAGKTEEIDTAKDQKEADQLIAEYRMAYGKGWTIWSK